MSMKFDMTEKTSIFNILCFYLSFLNLTPGSPLLKNSMPAFSNAELIISIFSKLVFCKPLVSYLFIVVGDMPHVSASCD